MFLNPNQEASKLSRVMGFCVHVDIPSQRRSRGMRLSPGDGNDDTNGLKGCRTELLSLAFWGVRQKLFLEPRGFQVNQP